ncbi:cation channel sperm-associated protein subunit gamma 1 isoform X10 [Mus musculus]|uniref:cation channel sperm-associated protein subunit gamma 1 isoform X10 n=2 Tax=Mus musculus TaxID=10090 RepID=UPI0003D75D3B|nr:cation channel sperm-associated protein subunit gamma 1 isoform X10 [Mus musculus]|eukprot:XP_006540145.1 PREDICTED: cation channel sperm-associated protein subunit gamma 1 isoform X9 [Mus musculus]
MDTRDERRWREKVLVGTVRIAKSAWVWNDGRSCGQRTIFTQERPRDQERSPGRDTNWGKERIVYERGFGKERAKWEDRSGRERTDWSEERLLCEETTGGEERPQGVERPHDQERFPRGKAGLAGRAGAEEKPPGREKGFKEKGCDEQEGQVALDPGRRSGQDQGRGQEWRRSEDPNYCNTWGLNQDQGRGQERRLSEGLNYRNTPALNQDQGRGQERRLSEDLNYCNTRDLNQDQGRGQERRRSEDPNRRDTPGLSQDQGRGQERRRSEDLNYSNTWGLNQDQGRGQERRRSEDLNYRNTPALNQDQGRGQERRRSEDLNYCNTWGLNQDQGRGQERRLSEDLSYCNIRDLNQDQGRGQEWRRSEDPNHRDTRGLSQDQGRGQKRRQSEDLNYCNTRGLNQDLGRGQERRLSEDLNYCNTRGLNEDLGRGQERRLSEDLNYCNTRGLNQDQGRGQERRQSKDWNYCNTWGLNQYQGRGQERRLSEDLNYCNTRCLNQDQGRSQERRLSKDSNYCNTWGLNQDQGHGQEKKQTEDLNYCNTRDLSQGQGRGQERRRSEDPNHRDTRGLSQDQGRGQERRQSEDLNYCNTQGLNQDRGRGQERRQSEHLNYCNTWSLNQDQGRGQERRQSEDPLYRDTPDRSQDQGRGQKRKQSQDLISRTTQTLSQGKEPSEFGGVGEDSRKDKKTLSRFLSRAGAKRKGRGEEQCVGGEPFEGGAKSPEGHSGSSYMVSRPAMSPVSPVWPRKPNLWAFWVLRLVLLLSLKSWAEDTLQHCTWLLVLNKFEKVGLHLSKDRFQDHEPIDTVAKVFQKLTDSPIDPSENYLSFPYYLQINFSCPGQLSIDSCWVGSFYCPILGFSATIHDAIATESTLFIRQNQLVYYFTGTYSTLFDKSHGSSRWVRVLPSECIKRLCPVYFSGNGSEYVLALTTGKNEGYIHIGTITDGLVSFEMVPDGWSVCEKLPGKNCSIDWATYITDERNLLLLVKIDSGQFYLVNFNTEFKTLNILYKIPEFIPEAKELDFLVLLDTVTYTNTPMTPKGLFFNTLNNMLYIWGNFILQSYNREEFIFLADFPKESTIKYMVNSFKGQMAVVTENEEIWYFLEGGYDVYQVVPSQGWRTYLKLQKMQKSPLYSTNESLVSLFYQDENLFQLVYLFDVGKERLVKRLLPVGTLMEYNLPKPFTVVNQGNYKMITFTNTCPFKAIHAVDVPKKQHASRTESYVALPPLVSESLGFHNNNTLAVYQGLVYYLLWLHSKYDKPYADPVHDPTWRWWQHKTKDKDYFFYLFSNRLAAEGIYINMNAYQKLYNMSGDYGIPDLFFLDKGNWFTFTVVLLSHQDTFTSSDSQGPTINVDKKLSLSLVLADPECLSVTATREFLLNRNTLLTKIKVIDKKRCSEQGMVGRNIKKTSMLIKVLGAPGNCIQRTYLGDHIQGIRLVPIFIGCPPGKRLAFDVSYTIKHSEEINKHYFDCVIKDAEMPCFLFRDLFQPFFLVQDLVTGDSGSFLGSYVLKVVGGGRTLNTIRDYTEEEIFRYNSPLDTTNSLIWKTKVERTTEDKKFYIMSHESPGVEWLCLENSPCYDIIPQSIYPPEFFFKLLVSNRGVDNSTYCDYKLTFIVHIHGLPLSSKRSSFIVMVSTSFFIALVVFYILFCLVWPHIVKAWVSFRWKIHNMMAPETYSSSSSSGGFTLHSHSSEGSFEGPSRPGTKEDNVQAKRAKVA